MMQEISFIWRMKKKIQNDKEEDAEDYDDYVIIKDILML